jgi:quercetin dioxygenase-like cupin family protein
LYAIRGSAATHGMETMGKPVTIVRRDEGEVLKVLGVDLRFVCRAEDTGGRWSLMDTVLPKDSGPPPHHHPWDEAYFVTAGEVEFTVADVRQTVRAGEFVYAPGGTVNSFRGISSEPARMLIFDAPAHAEAFFKDVDREVKEIPGDLPKLPGIGARHELHFLGR